MRDGAARAGGGPAGARRRAVQRSALAARLRPSGFSPLALSAIRSMVLRGRVLVGAAGQQQLHRLGAAGGGGEDERRLLAVALLGLDVGSAVDERGQPRRRRRPRRRTSAAMAPVPVAASTSAPRLDEHRHDGAAAALGRQVQRRDGAEARRRADVGARHDQRARPAPRGPDARPSAGAVTPSP